MTESEETVTTRRSTTYAIYHPKRIEILRQSAMGIDTKNFNEEVNSCVELYERAGIILHDMKVTTESDGLVVVLIFDKVGKVRKEPCVCDGCEKKDCPNRSDDEYTYCSARVPCRAMPSGAEVKEAPVYDP